MPPGPPLRALIGPTREVVPIGLTASDDAGPAPTAPGSGGCTAARCAIPARRG